MSEHTSLSAEALLVFINYLLVTVGPQCACITAPQLPPFGRLLVAAPRDNLMRSGSRLEMQRRATRKAPGHSSCPQHPAPYLRPRTGKPSKRSTRPPLCFQHVGPTSYGPRFGVAHPAGHGLVFRILRFTAGVLHIGGARYCFQWVRADDLAGRSLVVLRIGKTSGLLGVWKTPGVLNIGGTRALTSKGGLCRPKAGGLKCFASLPPARLH
jgi:hypothetical protein